jgi:Sap, sulfolipid-1-addressing protein
MNAEFFALAFVAALNPKLLAVDLLLIENRRPRAMFLCVLLGGLTVGITIGLLDVLVLHLGAISSQKTVSAGVDLALGLLLLAVGALVATGRLHSRRKAAVPATGGQPEAEKKKDGWARLPGVAAHVAAVGWRACLRETRYGSPRGACTRHWPAGC